MSTQEERHVAAERAWLKADLGDIVVKDTGGWETTPDGYTRKVFVENGDYDSVMMTFRVIFSDCCNLVVESYLE
jgi:hypothetical protein